MKKILLLAVFCFLFVSFAFAQRASTPSDFNFEVRDGTITITGLSRVAREVVIPDRINAIAVTAIGNDAFKASNLSSVVIPGSVTRIGDRAFERNQLRSVNLPNSVTYVGWHAFWGNQLNSVILPDSPGVSWQAFGENPLTSVAIGNNTNFMLPAAKELVVCEDTEPFWRFINCYFMEGFMEGVYTRPNVSSSIWTRQ